MPSVTQPLREEHRELLPEIESLRTAADGVGGLPSRELREAVDRAYSFLSRHLIPHAQAEDRALYPVVEKLLGAPGATATMRRDHVEVGRLTDELRTLRSGIRAGRAVDPGIARDLRRVLYGLYTLVKVHFAKEEEVYLPILDTQLDPEEAKRMFEAMHGAAREAKRATVGTAT